MLGVSPEDIGLKGGRLTVERDGGQSLSLAQVAAAAAAKGERLDVESYHQETETPPEGVFTACVAEVDVDIETGQVHLRKLNTVHDVATVLNPVGHQGQIDGGIMQGVGYALIEELAMEDSRVTTLNLGEYKIPNIRDIPLLQTTLVRGKFGRVAVSKQGNKEERYLSGRPCDRECSLRCNRHSDHGPANYSRESFPRFAGA